MGQYSASLMSGEGVTLGEALQTGGTTTFIGLSIVFAVLIILMIVLMLFKVIFYKDPKKKATKTQVENTQQNSLNSVDETTVKAVEKADVDEDELIAVLTAAVAASLNTSTYNLKIKSYRRTDNKMPAWNKAGVTETINNRF